MAAPLVACDPFACYGRRTLVACGRCEGCQRRMRERAKRATAHADALALAARCEPMT